jgi:hypothetical protein
MTSRSSDKSPYFSEIRAKLNSQLCHLANCDNLNVRWNCGETLMPYTIAWLLPDVIISERLTGQVSPDDVRNVNQDVNRLVKESASTLPIHLLIDVSEAEITLLNPKNLSDVVDTEVISRLGWVLMVSSFSPMLQKVGNMLVSVISHLYQFRYRNYPTRNEALNFLATIDDRVAEWLAEQEETVSEV